MTEAEDTFTIVKNVARYGSLGKDFPDEIVVTKGTKEHALYLADYLTNYFAGCDFMFYVKGME